MRDEDDPTALELDAGERELVDRLRALPPEGDEPDWQRLAAAIRAEVGQAAPQPWWRSWRWLVPIGALATTAALAFVLIEKRTHDEPSITHAPSAPSSPSSHDDAAPDPAHAIESTDETTAMWLDGEAVDVDDALAPALDELDAQARRALRPDETDVTGGILPASNLSWVDDLDDTDLATAEQWLTRKKS